MNELLVTGTTKFKPNEFNRNNNIKIAAEAINNAIINRGEEFSFNNVVGERTLEKGYKIAESIDNKKIVKSVGGGICQVSTTLNMAVKKLGLKITEVHKHSLPVFYAERDDEATIEWNNLDYKFINNKYDKIKIRTIYNNLQNKLTIKIYSA